MAGLIGSATMASQRTTGTVAKTLLQVTAPANAGIIIEKWELDFDGTSPTAGKIQVDLVLGATGGTSTSVTPAKVQGHSGSVTASAAENFSAEPSGGTVIKSKLIHPQSGLVYPERIVVPPSTTLGIRVTAPAAVDAIGSIRWEE